MALIDPSTLQGIQAPPMHIPDGFLSAPVAGACFAVSATVVALAVRRANRTLGERSVPLMGVMAAFIFAAQMMNFPVAGGTSGHPVGGALAAIFLGPSAAVIVMTSVIGVQALVFQDGGLAALGANVLNMAVAGPLLGYAVYAAASYIARNRVWLRQAGAFVAAWLTVMAGAALASFELAVSGTSPLNVVLPAMLGVHAFIGIGEGVVTVAALALVTAARRDLILTEAKSS